MSLRLPAAILIGILSAGHIPAQEPNVAFGGLRADPALPVEVSAESLTVDNRSGRAVFAGGVVISQGEMRLSAPTVEVEYENAERSRIKALHATGGVILVSGEDAAEAKEATYTVEAGIVVLTGDVVLTQGPSTMTGQSLTVNLNDGTGRMEGRVKTVLVPQKTGDGN